MNKEPERSLGSGRALVGERNFAAHECTLEYDENGRLEGARIVDAAGKPVEWRHGEGEVFKYLPDGELVLYKAK